MTIKLYREEGKPMIIDITPRIITFNGEVFELGTVRYIVDEKIMGEGKSFYPNKIVTPTVGLDMNYWGSAKVDFTVETKREQLQPTPLPVIEEKNV